MNVINISDYKEGKKQWEGKLKQGPTLFQTQKLVSQREITTSDGDFIKYIERQMIHELAEFLYQNGVCKITHEALPLDPFQSEEQAYRRLNASIMLFTGASNAKP